jgi:hypothetical protein
MRNVLRRLHLLEQLPQLQPPPGLLEHVRSRALRILCQEDLECLPAMEMPLRELSERETAACAAWKGALETEARRMGLKSFAAAKRSAGQRQ